MPVDRPYIYVYDASSLTDGQSYNGIAVNIRTDSDFLLRRVAGLPTVASKMQLRDSQLRNMFQAQAAIPEDWPVIPERLFPAGTFIGIDLNTVAKSSNAYAAGGSVPNYWSQVIFQGARRFQRFDLPVTPYSYYNYPAHISYDLTVDWTGRLASAYTVLDVPRRYNMEVRDWDFVLYGVGMTILTADGSDWVPCHGHIKFQLLDWIGNMVFSEPVTDIYVNMCTDDYVSMFPIPPLLYPVGTFIVFEISSLLVEAQVSATLQLDFFGTWRKPC